jgi:hypothetical protein
MLQKKFHKFSLTALALSAAIAYAPSGNAALTNGSFESPDASSGDVGGCATGWGCFNANFISSNNFKPGGSFVNPNAHDGTQVLKQYGVDAGHTQSIAAAAGDTVNASVYAMSWAGDPFNNLALLQIAYFDASDGFLGANEIFADSIGSQAYLLTPQDGGDLWDWTLMELSGVAPTNTARAQLMLLHILTDGTPAGGSIFWDDASLEVSAVPVPAAVWLFGSGLLGLVGVARRKSRV